MAIAASNKFAVESQRTIPIDYSAPYAPVTQSYHGFGIQVDGVYIGRITEWTPIQMARPGVHIRELNPNTYGQPVDFVPGQEENFALAFARAEVWGEEMERAVGFNDVFTLLVNQNRPFIVDEVYKRGNSVYRKYRYLGCWFTSKSQQPFQSEGGDSVIRINGEIAFVNRQKLI